MSFEGMWAVYFGDVAVGQVNSGVAVLETNKIFGGDSMMAYLGTFASKDSVITGKMRVWAYNPHQTVLTAFGKMGTAEGSDVELEGKINATGDEIDGVLWETANSAVKIPANLKKIANLPG